ncbi:uncharacterized protein LOC124254804 isoform X1 [Haliotis rubra]|uniref:uncharacterized protein LOC124254804 isoform X1 n=1 Tax=Haliotis rubra TaxID=36100 RepID=UPI001EE63342|nr:uncharacterized protein LOC124254804 isoform X1 [Haliotis rubra]XP_046544615.1 uncharacterized protein LOC124254804 isoform X1 [Haliotis rubra]
MRHLSSWILLLLSLFTPCTHNEVTVETCIGETASFKWDYKVPPFYAVEWYFGKTQIAEAFDEHLSQDSLSINGSYKSRFVLLEEDKIGFSLTNVNSEDNGDYKCIVNLRSTNVRVEKKGTLNVKALCMTRQVCSICKVQKSAKDPHPWCPDCTTVVCSLAQRCHFCTPLSVADFKAYIAAKKNPLSQGKRKMSSPGSLVGSRSPPPRTPDAPLLQQNRRLPLRRVC